MRARIIDLDQLLDNAITAIKEAGKVIWELYQSDSVKPGYILSDNPTTIADKISNQVISKILSQTGLPILSEEGKMIAFQERKYWNDYWLIDPLDGTKEFMQKINEFTVNIALIRKGRPLMGLIYVPCTDCLYYGSQKTGCHKIENGKKTIIKPLEQRLRFIDLLQKAHVTMALSRSHTLDDAKNFLSQFKLVTPVVMGSALKFIWVIENKADLYLRMGSTREWDIAAAHAIFHSLNRGVYQLDCKSELVYNKADLINPSFIAF